MAKNAKKWTGLLYAPSIFCRTPLPGTPETLSKWLQIARFLALIVASQIPNLSYPQPQFIPDPYSPGKLLTPNSYHHQSNYNYIKEWYK